MRAAVIGLGFVGRAHIEGLRRLGIHIQGLLDDPPNRTQEIAKSLGLNAYSSFEALLADRELDAVHICTPNYVHREQAGTCSGGQARPLREAACHGYEESAISSNRKSANRVGG